MGLAEKAVFEQPGRGEEAALSSWCCLDWPQIFGELPKYWDGLLHSTPWSFNSW